jgi:hypothetical protein
MDIFEQMEAAEFVLVSGDSISTSFTWDDDNVDEDGLEIAFLTIYVYNCDGEHELEFYMDDMRQARRAGDAWIVGTTKLEFCKIHPIAEPRSSRRDRFVDRCIEMRQAMNVVIRDSLIETDDITLELVKLEVKYMQQCLNEMEEEIQKIDFPDGLTQVA